MENAVKSITVIERPLHQNFDLLIVAQACGNLSLFKIGDGSVVISDLSNSIVQVGTIFKTVLVSKSVLAFCTDEGLAFAELKRDLKLVFKPHMTILPEKMVRCGAKLNENVILIADFDRPGYLAIDCKTRQTLFTIEETNEANKECLKIEPLPYFDFDALPYVMTLTATGLNIVNVKVGRSFPFKTGRFKDFDF